MGETLVALGKPRLVTLVNVGAAAVSIGANLVLIPWLGLVGAGWAAVVSTALSNGAQSWLVHRNGAGLDLRAYMLGHCGLLLALPLLWLGKGMVWQLAAIAAFALLNVRGGNITPDLIRQVFGALTTPGKTQSPPENP